MYPNDAPATDMSGYWQDGAYTPANTLVYIRDDFTPINKNAMINSVGKNLSLLENFVNSTYLGRSGTYVQDGYIAALHTGDLVSSGYVGGNNIYTYSHIVPVSDLGTNIGGASLRLGAVYSRNIYATYISGHTPTDLILTAGVGDFIQTQRDFIPSTDYEINIGSTDESKRWLHVYSSGFYGLDVRVNYLTSPGYVAQTNPGVVYLCCNLYPEYGVRTYVGAPGDAGRRLHYAISKYYSMHTSNTSYNDVVNDVGGGLVPAAELATTMWVDSSGFVRIGNHVAFSAYLK